MGVNGLFIPFYFQTKLDPCSAVVALYMVLLCLRSDNKFTYGRGAGTLMLKVPLQITASQS